MEFLPDDAEPARKTDPRFYTFLDAILKDRQEAARLLAKDPSVLELRSSIGETALHDFAVEDEIESVKWLLERGAKINTINDFGDTPLMDAASLDYAELCRFLLDHGANLRYINEDDDRSVFSKAATVSTPAVGALTVLLEYFPAEDNINEYFDDWHKKQVWEQGGEVLAMLQSRGLTEPTA